MTFKDLSEFIAENPWCTFGAWLVAFTFARSVGTIGVRYWSPRRDIKDFRP